MSVFHINTFASPMSSDTRRTLRRPRLPFQPQWSGNTSLFTRLMWRSMAMTPPHTPTLCCSESITPPSCSTPKVFYSTVFFSIPTGSDLDSISVLSSGKNDVIFLYVFCTLNSGTRSSNGFLQWWTFSPPSLLVIFAENHHLDMQTHL